MVVARTFPWGTVSATRLRLNPFRVLGLNVDATGAQVRRAAEKVAAGRRLGSTSAAPTLLPLPVPPDEDAVREAAHQLRDPATRLLAETFWLHPDPSPGPARWSLDAGQDLAELRRIWAQQQGERRAAAQHNLAVVTLIHAVDALEPNPVVPQPSPPVDGWWPDVLEAWSGLMDGNGPAKELQVRARALSLNAADLNSTARLNAALAQAVVDPLVEQLIRAVDATDGPEPDLELISDLSEAQFPESVAEDAVHRLVRHADERVRAVAEPGWARVRKDSSAASEVADELMTTLDRPLTLLQWAHDEDLDLGLAQRACDDVATTLAACAMRIADDDPSRRTDALRVAEEGVDYAIGKEAVQQATSVVASLSGGFAGSRLQATSSDPGSSFRFEDYLRTCVECGRPARGDGTLNIQLARRHVVTERTTLRLPWCSRCAFRGVLSLPLVLAQVLGLYGGIVAIVLWLFADLSFRWPLICAAAWFVSQLYFARRRNKMGGRLSRVPEVRQALAEGWHPAPGWGIRE